MNSLNRTMKAVKPQRAKLIVYFTSGPGISGRTFRLQGKNLETAVARGRKLVDKYRGKFVTACIYESNKDNPRGPLLEQYNADAVRVTVNG